MNKMADILEYSSWQEKVEETVTRKGVKMKTGKYVIEWKGKIRTSGNPLSPAEVEAAVALAGEEYKNRFLLEAISTGKEVYELPKEKVQELQEEFARELRRINHCNENDAKPLQPNKEIDMIKVAKKFDIVPGSDGWEMKVIDLVKADMHLAGAEMESTED